MIKSIEEQASEYATGDGGTIEKRKCFTVDLHLGNPQQYEYVKIYNNDAYCGFLAGAKARDAQWSAVVNELINYLMRIKDDPDFNFKGDVEMRISTKKSYAINALTKADQLLKEMGI